MSELEFEKDVKSRMENDKWDDSISRSVLSRRRQKIKRRFSAGVGAMMLVFMVNFNLTMTESLPYGADIIQAQVAYSVDSVIGDIDIMMDDDAAMLSLSQTEDDSWELVW